MVGKILKVSPRKIKALIDMKDGDGKTALYIAAERGRDKVVEDLLCWNPQLKIK